jgi:hypothetical protein
MALFRRDRVEQMTEQGFADGEAWGKRGETYGKMHHVTEQYLANGQWQEPNGRLTPFSWREQDAYRVGRNDGYEHGQGARQLKE